MNTSMGFCDLCQKPDRRNVTKEFFIIAEEQSLPDGMKKNYTNRIFVEVSICMDCFYSRMHLRYRKLHRSIIIPSVISSLLFIILLFMGVNPYLLLLVGCISCVSIIFSVFFYFTKKKGLSYIKNNQIFAQGEYTRTWFVPQFKEVALKKTISNNKQYRVKHWISALGTTIVSKSNPLIEKTLKCWTIDEYDYLFGTNIFDVLMRTTTSDQSSQIAPSVIFYQQAQTVKPLSHNLLDCLDRCNRTDELYQILRTRSKNEIEEVCRTFPIDTLNLDWNSILQDFRNSQRFELITVLAQILVRYEEILKAEPDLNLPQSLPGRELGEILMARLMPFIRKQKDVDVAHNLRTRLYEFALALMQSGRDRDALDCLLVSKPSLKEDHEYWICACRYNIALDTKSGDEVSAAVVAADRIADGTIKLPDRYVQSARQMLERLHQMQSG